jgi:hypothetical protein
VAGGGSEGATCMLYGIVNHSSELRDCLCVFMFVCNAEDSTRIYDSTIKMAKRYCQEVQRVTTFTYYNLYHILRIVYLNNTL